MSTGVEDPEKAAAQLLSGWWTDDESSQPLPVDPFEIARRLGLHVARVALPRSESGRIEFDSTGSATIFLNRADHRNRQRFTCAHELGHYARRTQTGAGPGRFVDYRSTLAGLGVDSEEIYANQFAAGLLMPAHLVRSEFRAGSTDQHMAQLFGTSVQAMVIRLKNLGLR